MYTNHRVTSRPTIIAHRGACAHAPENTIAAFMKAKEMGAFCLEFDVQLSSDEVPIIIHDDTLERTTNGHGLVAATTAKQLAKLDAGSWFAQQFAGEQIPTLEKAISWLHQHQLLANIELKANAERAQRTAELVLNHLQASWPSSIKPPLLSSFSVPILEILAKSSTVFPIALIVRQPNAQTISLAKKLNCSALHVQADYVDAKLLEQSHQQGLMLSCYTVNTKEHAKELINLGIDGFFTDDLTITT